MPHNVTERDGLFCVRQPAWHGLGTILEDYPSIDEAKEIAHPWEPISEPLYRAVPSFHEITKLDDFGRAIQVTVPFTDYQEVSDFRLNVRSDDGGQLGVVGEGYTTVFNSEMYEIAEAIEGEDAGAVQLETGGSLLGGRKVWLLLRLRDPLELAGDPRGATIPYYALQNNHDGGGSFRGQATVTRIVCDNTSQIADLDARARGTEFVFRHTKSVTDRIEEAKVALAGWRVSLDHWRAVNEGLLDIAMTKEQMDDFIERFIPHPPPSATSVRVVNNVNKAHETFWEIVEGVTCEGIAGTAYGTLQAAVEYVEHYRRANTRETLFKRAYLDRSAVVARASELVMAVTR